MQGLSAKSAWTEQAVTEFLDSYRAPIRVAATSASGFPLLCSLWFTYHDGKILCATQRDAVIARQLERDGRCAFEISPNDPPYFGLRGRGNATLAPAGADELLENLISRYLGEGDTPFREWLLKRSSDEVCIIIDPVWVTTWDYRSRMET